MNKIRPFILGLAVILSGLVAFGLFTMPEPKAADAEGFSSARVVKDIEVISKEHHSVAHPQERASVREYLVGRLEGLGADTVKLFEYDSLVGPKNKHVVYTFDAVNVLAEFAPENATDSTAYLMFVAHYDSRYSQPMPRDTVWSYGAADDGYGLGVILESMSHLLKNRQDWKQGVKVLFTDAEEVGMMGMTAMWEGNREVFDNVGLVINIEARGPYGPALMFEACPGNDKVLGLYADAAKYPFTYSLTTVVYQFMPNFTDFTIIKDYVPGLNFSTIADINHYHTDLDNLSNIDEQSIQHYGEQVLPVAQAYVTSDEFASKDALRSDKDVINFSIPALGLLSFSKNGYTILCVVIFILFLLAFAVEGFRGRLKAMRVFKTSGIVLGSAVGVLLLGELFAYACAAGVGAKFNLFGIVQGVPFDNMAMALYVALVFAGSLLLYYNGRTKVVRATLGSMRVSAAHTATTAYALNLLYASLALLFVLSAALLFAIGENMMFFIPFAFATFALILWRLTSIKSWLPVAIAMILLHAFSFLYALSMALTIGALGAVAMIAFLDMMVLIPLADLYLMYPKKK
jgi:hypothetical protein